MGTDSTNGVTYVLEIDGQHQQHLGGIRHWEGLLYASEEGRIWIKGLSSTQIESTEIRSIPFAQLFRLETTQLIPLGKQLPVKFLPTLLWTPIHKALAVELPLPNPNFFELNDSIDIQLGKAEQEHPTTAILIPKDQLAVYIQSAPEVRLQVIRWVVFNQQALITGHPLLPLPGQSFWANGDCWLPTGYDFIQGDIGSFILKQVDPNHDHIMIWLNKNNYSLIAKKAFQPLNRSSFAKAFYAH